MGYPGGVSGPVLRSMIVDTLTNSNLKNKKKIESTVMLILTAYQCLVQLRP